MAFYFALFNVSAINLEEQGKRQQYKELRKSTRRGSTERKRQGRCRSAEGRQSSSRRPIARDKPRSNATLKPNDNTSINSATLATQEETLSVITANWSMDSIPLALDDYAEFPKPRSANVHNRKKKGSPKAKDLAALTRASGAPPMANGDISRATDENEVSGPIRPTPREHDPNRPKPQTALARRGSTPSYKRVTFRHEQLTMMHRDSESSALMDSHSGKRNSVTSGGSGGGDGGGNGIFSKSVNFLGRHSLDDHRRRHQVKHDAVHDRPFPKAVAEANKNSSSPRSALNKLRTVIRKVMIENRRQRLLASHWPREHNAASGSRKTSIVKSKETDGEETESSIVQEGTPTLTPTSTEIAMTPTTEQMHLDLQNIANTMLEMQQHKAIKNHYDPSWSTRALQQRTSLEYQHTRIRREIEQPNGAREAYSDTVQTPHVQYRHQQPLRHHNSWDEWENIGNLEGTVDHELLRNQPIHQGWTKRMSAEMENTVKWNGKKAGSYHPQRMEEHIPPDPLRQFLSRGVHQQHRAQNGQTDRPRWQAPLRDRTSPPSAPRESLGFLKRHVGILAQGTPPRHVPVQRQIASPLRRNQPNEKNERTDKTGSNVIRRHSTVGEKSRSLLGSAWSRWLRGGAGNTSTGKSKTHVSSAESAKSEQQQPTEFQTLLSQVRYDENRNVSFDSGGAPVPSAVDETPLRFGRGRSYRNKHTRSLIIGFTNCKTESGGQSITTRKKPWRRRLALNCYINPLFSSHSAPNSPAKKLQQPQSQIQRGVQ